MTPVRGSWANWKGVGFDLMSGGGVDMMTGVSSGLAGRCPVVSATLRKSFSQCNRDLWPKGCPQKSLTSGRCSPGETREAQEPCQVRGQWKQVGAHQTWASEPSSCLCGVGGFQSKEPASSQCYFSWGGKSWPNVSSWKVQNILGLFSPVSELCGAQTRILPIWH